MSKILARVIGGGGSAGTATSNDVLSGKTFSNDDDVDIVGTATEYPTTEHHVTTADQIIIPANSHTTGKQILKGIKEVKLPASTIRSGKTVTINNGEKNIVSINGTYTSSISNGQQPVTADKIVSGYSGFVNGSNEIQGSIPDKSGTVTSASAIDMNGSDIRMKIPTDGFYSSSSYIKSQSVNFGDALASEVAAGKTFTSSSGLKIQGSAPLQNDLICYQKTYDQTIMPAGRFTNGNVILKGITTSGLTPENIRTGAAVNLWNGIENIISIAGQYPQYKIMHGYLNYIPWKDQTDEMKQWYKYMNMQLYGMQAVGTVTVSYMPVRPGFTPLYMFTILNGKCRRGTMWHRYGNGAHIYTWERDDSSHSSEGYQAYRGWYDVSQFAFNNNEVDVPFQIDNSAVTNAQLSDSNTGVRYYIIGY